VKCTSIIFCLLLGFVLVYSAQSAELSETPARIDTVSDGNGILSSLDALAQDIDRRERELLSMQHQAQVAPDRTANERMRKARAEIREQQLLFERLAVDVDISTFSEKTEVKFDWQQQIGKLLKPIMAEVEFATRQSRAIGELRAQISIITAERDISSQALANLDKLAGASVSPVLSERLERMRMLWKQRFQGAQDRLTALDNALEKKLAEQQSPFDASMAYVRNFLRTRGQNLLLGIIAFCVVFFGIRFLMSAWGMLWKHKKRGNRLVAISIQALRILGGVAAMLMVFSFTADWFLLAVTLIFLIGIGWASFKTLPQNIEILQLMMNTGAVREGERIVMDGIPWQVESIGLKARLINPLLDGGEQILPLKMLVGKYSRPAGKAEEWFPCRKGDLIQVDGKTGRVTYQTPGAVQIVEADGVFTVYQTPAFLALNPRNYSANLRVTSTFGVDYKHQAECTTQIPEVMLLSLKRELPKIVDPTNIRNVFVMFKTAALSSLDYEVWVDLTGNAALDFKIVEFHIQRILVDTCNEHGWEIPLNQVMIHQGVI
jgi:hypothetical protein